MEALQRAEKLTRLIEELKQHNGPLNSEEEIRRVVEENQNAPNKLQTILNKEIRFRRDANLRYAVSATCPLYKQRNITNEQRTMNLIALVQRKEGTSYVTLDDLRAVYYPQTPQTELTSSGTTEDESSIADPVFQVNMYNECIKR